MQSITFKNSYEYKRSPCIDCIKKINEPIFISESTGIPVFLICAVEYGTCKEIEHFGMKQHLTLDVKPYS